MDPCFPHIKEPELDLPSYIEPLDKISISSKVLELHTMVGSAREPACHYRDRCSELKIQVMQAKAQNAQIQAQALDEKQKVRFFWRNQVLEGKSRSGRIVRNALKI